MTPETTFTRDAGEYLIDDMSVPNWKWEGILDILMVFGTRHGFDMVMTDELYSHFNGASANQYYTDYSRKDYVFTMYNRPDEVTFKLENDEADAFLSKMLKMDRTKLERLWLVQFEPIEVMDYLIDIIKSSFAGDKADEYGDNGGTNLDKLEKFINETFHVKDKSSMALHVSDEFADIWSKIEKIEHMKRIRNAFNRLK